MKSCATSARLRIDTTAATILARGTTGLTQRSVPASRLPLLPSSRGCASSSASLLSARHQRRWGTAAPWGTLHPSINRAAASRPAARSGGRWALTSIQSRSMFIQTEATPNPDSIKLIPDGQVVLESGTMDFPDARSSLVSPLAKALFTVPGVQRVFFGHDFLTVSKSSDVEWHEIKAQLFAHVMDFYASGEPVLSQQQDSSTTILPDDSETVAMIKELLETRIRPSVQDDGGDIVYKGFDEQSGVVFLKMVGSCSGCPSSSVTLKNGIERMLMHWIKEVTGVVAVESDDELDRLNKREFAALEAKLHTDESGASTA